MVLLLPEQMVPDGVMVVATVGDGLTVIICVVVPVHPFVVPVTVYVVIVVGETVTVAPDKLPGIQLYVVAPLAVIIVEVPLQIVAAVVVTVTVGEGVTVMVLVAVFVQPFAAVPVTV